MITNFKIFESLDKNLIYEDVKSLSTILFKIKKELEKYPDKKIFKFHRSFFSAASIKTFDNILKLAREKHNEYLIDLVLKLKEKIEEIKIKMNVNKYNL